MGVGRIGLGGQCVSQREGSGTYAPGKADARTVLALVKAVARGGSAGAEGCAKGVVVHFCHCGWVLVGVQC